MSKKKAVSDSRLMSLWRKAVLAKWNYTDPLSGHCDPSGESLQCHHVVKRRHFLTRWDPENGVPLTVESHQLAHTGAGAARLRELVKAEYLDAMEGTLKKDYLQEMGISEDDFRRSMRDKLLAVIDE